MTIHLDKNYLKKLESEIQQDNQTIVLYFINRMKIFKKLAFCIN
jgi:hypothetical protein